jgi:hypothetical protein
VRALVPNACLCPIKANQGKSKLIQVWRGCYGSGLGPVGKLLKQLRAAMAWQPRAEAAGLMRGGVDSLRLVPGTEMTNDEARMTKE